MIICKKRGASSKDGSIACSRCRQPLEAESVQQAPESVDESIKLAAKLIEQFAEKADLEKAIAENEAIPERPLVTHHVSYSKFHYFWPFLLADVVIAPTCVLILSEFLGILGWVAGIIIAVGMLFSGIAWAGKKADASNSAATVQEEKELDARKKSESDNSSNKIRLNALQKKLSAYDSLIPPLYRNSNFMIDVYNMLKNGNTSNFTNALNILGGQ